MSAGIFQRRLFFLVATVIAVSCSVKEQAGCANTPAGGPCNPEANASQCQTGYYCAWSETCTRHCSNDSDCRVDCSSDAGACYNAGECHVDSGQCEGSRNMSCVAGFCQGNCDLPADGGGCEYDFYGPSRFQHQDGG